MQDLPWFNQLSQAGRAVECCALMLAVLWQLIYSIKKMCDSYLTVICPEYCCTRHLFFFFFFFCTGTWIPRDAVWDGVMVKICPETSAYFFSVRLVKVHCLSKVSFTARLSPRELREYLWNWGKSLQETRHCPKTNKATVIYKISTALEILKLLNAWMCAHTVPSS